jgi:hypothetical protein
MISLKQNVKGLAQELGGIGTSVQQKVEKGGRCVNMEQKMCIHVCKCKIILVETTPGIRGVGDKGDQWGR